VVEVDPKRRRCVTRSPARTCFAIIDHGASLSNKISRLSPGRRSRSLPESAPDSQTTGELAQEKGGLIALKALLALIFLAAVPDAGLHPGTFLAYLAFRSIFFPHESAGQGAYLSFLSQSAFFFRKPLRNRKRNQVIQESPKTTDRGCKPDPSIIGDFSASCAAVPPGQRPMKSFQTCPNERWEPPHLCGGRSALALLERVSTLITRFSPGNAKALSSAEFWFCIRARLPSISCIGLMSHGPSCGFPCEKTARADLSSIHGQEIEV
jgi:hypothetical protein